MVKLSQGSELINRIASKLQDVLNGNISGMAETRIGGSNLAVERTTALYEYGQQTQNQVEHVDNSLDQEFWDIDCKTLALFFSFNELY